VEIEKIVKVTGEYIDSLCSPERAKEVSRVLEELGTTYITAPASGKTSYHNCFDGGLAEHNLNVLANLLVLNETFEMGFSDETILVTALFHDIGKVLNTDKEPYYQVTTDKWKRDRGEKYQGVPGSTYLPTHQRSVWLLQSLNFHLTADEYQAILLNDGQYVQENRVYAMKEGNLARLVHMADMLALMKETKAQSDE
jgi:hypothetical protein